MRPINPLPARALFAALTLVAATGAMGALGPSTHPSDASTEYVVAMGGVDPSIAPNPNGPGGEGRVDRFEYMTFYPDHLRVHRGATVHFQRAGFHTVAFAPSEDDVPRAFRRDEVEGTSALGGEVPTDPSCATDRFAPPAQPIGTSCVFDDATQVLNSGWGSMRVTMDLQPGMYDYWCTIHDGMRGVVEVVPDADPVPTPTQVDAIRDAQLEADTVNGEALLAAGQTPVVEPAGDHRRWYVKAGDTTEDGRVMALRFLPSVLEIAPDDEVVFTTPDSPVFEIHTASFPADAYPLGFLTYLNPNCDPDGRSTGSPGVPLQFGALVLGCGPGTALEIGYQPWAWSEPLRAPGDVVATPLSVHDSGLLAPGDSPCRSACDPWTNERFPSTSRTVFAQTGTFTYICNVHPEWGMAGSIVVAP